MTGNAVNGNGKKARSGAHALSLLAVPLNSRLLRSLAAGPKSQTELRRESGSPAQSTLRSHLSALEQIGAIAKRRRNAFPGSNEYDFEPPGRDLLFVIECLERWLTAAPEGPLELGSESARPAVKALVDAWSSTMLRALAARPLSLTELDRIVDRLSYPSLERRLGAMRLACQVEPLPGNWTGTPYTTTDWLGLAVGPLVAAIRWERRHRPAETPPIEAIDAETMFLLAIPLLSPPTTRSGSCRLAMELPNGDKERMAGVAVTVEDGRIASCTTRIQTEAGAWAIGSPASWFRAIVESDRDRLQIGGDCRLAEDLLAGLSDLLFGVESPQRS